MNTMDDFFITKHQPLYIFILLVYQFDIFLNSSFSILLTIRLDFPAWSTGTNSEMEPLEYICSLDCLPVIFVFLLLFHTFWTWYNNASVFDFYHNHFCTLFEDLGSPILFPRHSWDQQKTHLSPWGCRGWVEGWAVATGSNKYSSKLENIC